MASRMLVCLCLAAILPCPAALADPQPAEPEYEHLAVATDANGPWTFPKTADELPQQRFFVRSGPAAVNRLELQGLELFVAASTRLSVDVGERLIRLESGRVAVQTLETDRWKIELPEAGLSMLPGARVMATVAPGGKQTVHDIVAGVTIRLGEVSVKLHEPQKVEIQGGKWKSSLLPPPAESQALLEWTKTKKRTTQGMGQLLVEDAQSGSTYRLNIARYHVNIVLQPPVALVQIDQSFYNPFLRQKEGTFVFNLPEGASVSRFAMYTAPDRLVEGELIEWKNARRIYSSIVRSMRDPAILEQIGDNLFKMRVFPIFAQDTKRVLLDYTVPLTDVDGQYRFELPLLSDLEPIWDFRAQATFPKETKTWRSSISGPEVDQPRASANNGGVAPQKADKNVFDLQLENYKPDRNLALEFNVGDRETPEITEQSFIPAKEMESDDRRPYFMVSVPPTAVELPEIEDTTAPADLLILADTSGGIDKPAAVYAAVRTIVKNLRPTDRVRVAGVDVAMRPLCEEWLQPNTPELKEALSRLRSQLFLGSSDLVATFRAGNQLLQQLREDNSSRRQFLVYVGDGELRESLEEVKSLPKLLAEIRESGTRFVAVLTETKEAGLGLLELLARRSGGQLFDLAADPDSDGKMFRWLLSGLNDRWRVTAEGLKNADEQLFCKNIWQDDRALQVFGRAEKAGPISFRLRFEKNGEVVTREWTIALKPDKENLYIGRLWAQRKLDTLSRLLGGAEMLAEADGNIAADADDNIVKSEILELSQRWSLLSPLTAFLVLEKEEDYAKWQINRRTRYRYWKPPAALPVAALPKDWVKRAPQLASRFTASSHSEYNHVADLLEQAREALEAGFPDEAQAYLEAAAMNPGTLESAEMRTLREQAAKLQAKLAPRRARQKLLATLGAQRFLLERHRLPARLISSPALNPLLSFPAMSDEFRKRHPHATMLVRRTEVEKTNPTLVEFVNWIKQKTGLPMHINQPALNDEGIALRSSINLEGIRSMSWRNLLYHGLKQLQMTAVPRKDQIEITTTIAAEEVLDVRLYPVASLYLPEQPPTLEEMANPYLDFDEEWRRQVERKLGRPLNAEFDRTPLKDVVRQLSRQLNENVALDEPALNDEGIAIDVPVTFEGRELAARELLALMLKPLQLQAVPDRELLRITTSIAAEEALEVRLHGGAGLVFQLDTPRWVRKGKGGLGGPRFGAAFGGFGGGGFGGGGFGGGGGFFGGGGQGAGEVAIDDGALSGLSETLTPPREEDEQQTADESDYESLNEPVRSHDRKLVRRTVDYDETAELVTSTVAPDSWEDVGGPATIAFFEPTLDFVVRQTMEAHREIEKFLKKIRTFPIVRTRSAKKQPATLRRIPQIEFDGSELDDFIELIESTIAPDCWEAVGGPGVITEIDERMVLAIRQTPEVHEELDRLLTELKRRRYGAMFGIRPWETFATDDHGAFLGRTQIRSGLRSTELPEADADELQLLTVRREPVNAERVYEYAKSPADARQVMRVRRFGNRIEIRDDDLWLRIDGDDAALAYPGLGLVEIGEWGEELRRRLDARFPWMPHRTNQELARMFEVTAAGEDDASVTLRLGMPQSEDSSKNYLEARFSRANGMPLQWRAVIGGQPTLQLAFDYGDDANKEPRLQQVTLSHPDGRNLESWRVTGHQPMKDPLPGVDEDWTEFVPVDSRARGGGAADTVRQVLGQWESHRRVLAASKIRQAMQQHPERPLLQFLFAWTRSQQPKLSEKQRGEIVESLTAVSRRGMHDLVAMIGRGGFREVSREERLEILLAQPVESRSAENWRLLTETALRQGAPAELLEELLAQVLAIDRPTSIPLIVKLHLALGRDEEAMRVAREWAAEEHITTEQLSQMIQELHHAGQKEAARELMAQTLSKPDLSPDEVSSLERQQADLYLGMPRWRLMLSSLTKTESGTAARRYGWRALKHELSDPQHSEVAAQLAAGCDDKVLRLALQLHQAELDPNPQRAADLCWTIFTSGRLPESKRAWAVMKLAETKQHARVAVVLEDQLARERSLSHWLLIRLAEAYSGLGREMDARRARSHELERREEASPWENNGWGNRGGGFF